jgi:hypothetical protein
MHATTPDFSKKLPSDYLSLERAVTRNAGTVIKDPHALLLLRFIADRTFGWSKPAEIITPTQFLNGIVTRAGEWVCAGLPFGKTTLYAALKILKAAGAIVVETVRGRTRYSIPVEFAMELKMSKAARARLAPAEQPETYNHARDLGNDFGSEWQEAGVRETNWEAAEVVRQTNAKETSPELEKKNEADASCHAGSGSTDLIEQKSDPLKVLKDLTDQIAQGSARAAPAIEKRAARAAAHNPAELYNAFASTAWATWPDMKVCPLPNEKQVWRLRSLSRKWDHPDISFEEFLEWCAANWRGVWASKMEHVQANDPTFQFTDYPDIGTLIYFRRAFRDSFDRRASQKIRAGLTREDGLVRRLMFRGYSHADALTEAAEIIAKDRKLEDLDAREAELNAKVRRVEAKEQSLETRIALGRAAAVKPVALTKHPLKPTFSHGNDAVTPLPAFPTWKDHPDA